jgi:hypothetical protein
VSGKRTSLFCPRINDKEDEKFFTIGPANKVYSRPFKAKYWLDEKNEEKWSNKK